MISHLHKVGIKFALDDFGCGYSSLSYLDSYNIDVIKIDRSFVAKLHTHPKTMAIAEAIIRLGHALNLQVVAEGVENATQLQTLLDLGCDFVQGYFLGRPVPTDAVDALLIAASASPGPRH